MEELNLELLNEIIVEISNLNCHSFSNLHEAMLEFNDSIDQEELADYLTENYNITSEEELLDLTDYERNSLIKYIGNVY